MVRKLLSILLALSLGSFTVLTGCAGKNARAEMTELRRFSATVDTKLRDVQTLQATNTEAATVKADEAYEAALKECRILLRHLEMKATGFRWTTVGIALIGSIAGAILIPAFNTAALANKALVSALGGVSGVANTAQGALREAGLTSDEIVRQREAIRVSLTKAIEDYKKARKENKPADQGNAVIDIQAVCAAYSVFTPLPAAELPEGPPQP